MISIKEAVTRGHLLLAAEGHSIDIFCIHYGHFSNDGETRLLLNGFFGCNAMTIWSIFFLAYTFIWCSSTFVGVKQYLQYTSSGGCFRCFQPSFPKRGVGLSSVMECLTTTISNPFSSYSCSPASSSVSDRE